MRRDSSYDLALYKSFTYLLTYLIGNPMLEVEPTGQRGRIVVTGSGRNGNNSVGKVAAVTICPAKLPSAGSHIISPLSQYLAYYYRVLSRPSLSNDNRGACSQLHSRRVLISFSIRMGVL